MVFWGNGSTGRYHAFFVQLELDSSQARSRLGWLQPVLAARHSIDCARSRQLRVGGAHKSAAAPVPMAGRNWISR
jgi:hypothetical protein